MLAVHELEEIIIGDLTFWDISLEEKKLKVMKQWKKLSSLIRKEEIKDLIFEFDDRKTREALFAYHCDKLERDLQCKLYDEEGCVDMDKQIDNKIYNTDRIQNIIKDGNPSWSSMWLKFDRSKFIDDDNFIEVLDYAKKYKIK